MSLYKGAFVLSSGALVARVFGVLALPVITRMYSTDDVGTFATFVGLTAVFLPLASLSYLYGMPVPRSPRVAICLGVLSTLAVTVSALVLCTGYLIFQLVHLSTIDAEWIFFLALALWLTVVLEVVTFWALRQKRYTSIAWMQVTKGGCTEGTKIAAGLGGLGAKALLVGHIVGLIAAILVIRRSLAHELRTWLRMPSWRRNLTFAAKRYREYPRHRMPAQLLSAYGVQAPVLLTSLFFSASWAGQLSLATMVVALPVNLLGQSMSRALYSEVSELWKVRADRHKIRPLIESAVWRLAVLVAPGAIAAYFTSGILFALLFGSEWRLAGEIVSLLSVYLFFQMIAYPLLVIFNFGEGQGELLQIHLQRAILVTVIFAGLAYLKIDYLRIIGIYGVVMSAHYIAILWRIRRKLGRLG